MLQSNTITLTGEVAQAAAFIEWAHGHGVEVSAISVGQCTVHLAPRRGASSAADSRPTMKSIHEQFGGKVFEDAVEGPDDDQEFQPVVGRT